MSDFSLSSEYASFRSSVPLRNITVDCGSNRGWKVYDSGPKSVKTPLVCLPPACGTADVYFKQILGLSAKGIRVISAEHPVYWSIEEWCSGFKKLIDVLELDKIHLFGASLGGFLAQKFVEYTENCPRIASLILCNTFCDTSVFQYNEKSHLFWALPSMILKKMIMVNLPICHTDKRIVDSIDFMVEKLDSLSQQDLASRLTINCINSYVNSDKLRSVEIVTIIDVFDECALSAPVREVLYKCYPQAKLAHLKAGGNFPYLSRSEEVNLHLQIHLLQFDETDMRARDL
ncbi:Spastic paraplegia 21 (Autosomal recessive, Mast syndrome) [Nesidiocoris tenuis]|uniref:Spastic paraplegia 21 (Autosomal recessive, Mast syndrome) n=1 Tax=Nesidiocoris tenuis TaxID=355587 RepID=A0ABN7ACE0_9HEMI|nr:Spastic paraplegia 21 (Autosomal recessive, Mast syndrome) [Nesidiocoris tenuis]